MSDSQYVEVAIPAKFWLKSKTLWWNFLTIAAAGLGLVIENAAALGIDDRTKIWIGIGLTVLNAIGNMILRITPENVPLAAGRGQFQFKAYPKSGLIRPPDHPATNPPRWGQDWRDVGPS